MAKQKETATPGIVLVPLGDILPNPWQAERAEAPQALQELAQSILIHGMVETPAARPLDEPGKGSVQLATGHRRLAAHRLLAEQGHQEFSKMRVRVIPLGDQQMADVVLQENKRRQDLDPIAEARFYRRYLDDFKVTQTELAKRVGCSQGEVANTLRLLELPEDAQGMVISQEITARHGRELLRASRWPEVQRKVLETMKKPEGKVTVEELGQRVEMEVLRLALPLEGYYGGDQAGFDVAGCANCPDNVKGRKASWQDKKHWCVKPECWKEKQAVAEAKRAEEIGTGGVVRDLKYDEYHGLSDSALDTLDNPDECRACTGRRILEHGGTRADVCIDLKCWSSKKAKKTKAENEAKALVESALTQRIDKALEGGRYATRAATMMVLEALDMASTVVSRALRAIYGDKAKDPLPSLLHDTDEVELRHLLCRVAARCLCHSWPRGRLVYYLWLLEGGSGQVMVKLADGSEREFDLYQIYTLEEQYRDGSDSRYSLYCHTDGGTASHPIARESFEELCRVGVEAKRLPVGKQEPSQEGGL